MKIAILTLTGQRDKYIDQLLAEHLRKYGHEVTVRNYIYAGHETVCYEKPDAIVHPMPGGQYKYDFIQLCKKWGVEVIVRRGEAGMGRKEFEQLDPNRKTIILSGWDYSRYVDLELTWGPEFTDIIAEQGCMPKRKLRSCGAFAFDPYFMPDFQRNLNHEKTVLFATGFSTCDCRSEYCELGLPQDNPYHEEIYAIHRKARDKWIEAINNLVRAFGSENWRYELKVRPGEMEEEYKQKLNPAVKIHPQTSVSSQALRDIDILVHSGSTMAIEAHLLNIPAFNYCNVNPDGLLASVSPRLESYEELEWNIARAQIYQSNINEAVFHELEEHLYGPIDGKACERAAQYINEHISGKKIKTNIPNTWPKTAKYHKDKKNIHLKRQPGDVSWLCPCCRNQYFVVEGLKLTACPYCGMGIEMTNLGKPKVQGVVK